MPQQPTRYQQIADDLRRRIVSGEFPGNTALPPEVELQARYSASRNTVRDAVKLLVHSNFVKARPGLGIFVSKRVER